MKRLSAIIFGLLLGVASMLQPAIDLQASERTLYSCYQERGFEWGSVEARAAEAAKHGIWQYQGTAEQNTQLVEQLCGAQSDDLGFTVFTDYQKALSAQMTQTQTFVPVTSLQLRDGTYVSSTVAGNRIFLTIEPGAVKEEIVFCTGTDQTLNRFTGCTRGLSFSGTSTAAVTANQKTHNAGSTVVISNVHYVYDQYLDRTGQDQDIAGIKTFVSSTLQIGDDTTSTAKFIKFPVGQGNEPYFKVVGPPTGNTTSTFYFSIDGLSDLQLNASGTVVAASSTKAIGISNGLIYFVASSTRGGLFDANGAFYFNASTTQGLTWGASGDLQFDPTRNFTFTGTVTSTGALRVPTPSQAQDAVNLTYLQSSLVGLTATTTAAQAITAGQALFLTVTSTVNPTDTSNGTSTFFFVGFATANASAAAEVTYTRPGGINCNQSGLSPGAYYYLSGASGAIAITGNTTNNARVGLALTATCIQVLPPRYKLTGTYSTGAVANGTTSRVNTFFYPARVSASAFAAGPLTSITHDTDAGGIVSSGGTVGGPRIMPGGSIYLQDESGSCYWRGDVAKDRYGMTITNSNYSGAGCGNMVDMTIQYSVSSE